MGFYRTGQLKYKITIESPTSTADSYGAPSITWSKFTAVYAAKRHISARERFRADRFVSENIAIFSIRWVAGITTQMRIKFHNGSSYIYYQIKGVNEVDKRRWLEIIAEQQE